MSTGVTFSFEDSKYLKIKTNFEEIKNSLGPFIKPIWHDISMIEFKKLFLLPYLRSIHNFDVSFGSIVKIEYCLNNFGPLRLCTNHDSFPNLPTEVFVMVDANKRSNSLLYSKYPDLKEYFEDYNTDRILKFSEEELSRLVEPKLRLQAAEFHRDLREGISK